MRFESVRAYAFGMLKNKTLEFAPGMTVIYGPNESGKSTWHAALYAGLCGIRRARGQPTSEEKHFAERHRPWDDDAWEVSVRLRLDDGRHVELRHNLATKTDSHATDLDLGRDVSHEISVDGSIDGARWLGLDRRSFLAVACVGQADILGVLDSAEDLQEYLARAAATARRDATAAEAIIRLEDYRDAYVGTDRAWTKPLRRAQDAVRAAEVNLEIARAEHTAFLELMARRATLEARAEELQAKRRLYDAAAAWRDALEWDLRASRARELFSRFPDGAPASLVEDSELAERVAAAISAWETRPSAPELQGPSSEVLQKQIEALPSMPEGDLEPYPDVTAARGLYEEADRSLAVHDRSRPPTPEPPGAGGAFDQELRDLARELELPEPTVDPGLQSRYEHAISHVRRLGVRPFLPVLVVLGLLTAGISIALAASGFVLAGALTAVAGGALVVALVAHANGTRARGLEELRAAENAIGERRHAAADAARRRNAARSRARALGIPADPPQLRNLAELVARAELQQRELDRWATRRQQLRDELDNTAGRLEAALRTRGISVGEEVETAWAAYVAECAERSRVAKEAGKRLELASRLAAREAAEEAHWRLLEAGRALREAAAACGIFGEDPEELRLQSSDWQEQRRLALEEHQAMLQAWGELQALLGGRTLEELVDEAQRRREAATTMAQDIDVEQLVALARMGDLDAEVLQVRRDGAQASSDADTAQGQLRERSENLAAVSVVEEELQRARAELERISRLQRTLDLTLQFLREAQERAHRTIAPVLAQSLTRFLPEVTAGRYAEAVVDPETLEVRIQVQDGTLRPAVLLSHGTAEQVYFLLRLALAQHLARIEETCPMIFDDATAQSDRVRKEAIMRCLQTISRERQVIVFSQEDEVLAWAQQHLDGVQDRLVRLDVGA